MSAFSDFGVPGLILCRPIDAYFAVGKVQGDWGLPQQAFGLRVTKTLLALLYRKLALYGILCKSAVRLSPASLHV